MISNEGPTLNDYVFVGGIAMLLMLGGLTGILVTAGRILWIRRIVEKEIRGNPYPVVSSRTYDYSVIIPSGYTLAIGGLSENNQITLETRVSIFVDIPVFGYAFRINKDKKTRRNLVAYITLIILDSTASEIAKK